MFRASLAVRSALASTLKSSTGITGLAVHPDPLPALASTYKSTLSLLQSLPETSVYRQATEAITKHRLSLVESAGGDIRTAEKGLGGMIETSLEEAKAEEGVAGKMIEWKAWENLSTPSPPNQWRYFDPGSE